LNLEWLIQNWINPSGSAVSHDVWLLSPSGLRSGGCDAEDELLLKSEPLLYSNSGIVGVRAEKSEWELWWDSRRILDKNFFPQILQLNGDLLLCLFSLWIRKLISLLKIIPHCKHLCIPHWLRVRRGFCFSTARPKIANWRTIPLLFLCCIICDVLVSEWWRWDRGDGLRYGRDSSSQFSPCPVSILWEKERRERKLIGKLHGSSVFYKIQVNLGRLTEFTMKMR